MNNQRPCGYYISVQSMAVTRKKNRQWARHVSGSGEAQASPPRIPLPTPGSLYALLTTALPSEDGVGCVGVILCRGGQGGKTCSYELLAFRCARFRRFLYQGRAIYRQRRRRQRLAGENLPRLHPKRAHEWDTGADLVVVAGAISNQHACSLLLCGPLRVAYDAR